MVVRRASAALAVLLMTGAVSGAAVAKGNGGGGGGGGGHTPAPPLPTPAIPPGTFEGIGPGPVYVRDSFGFAQRTRYKQDGSIVDVVDKPEVNGIRAEFPNNRSETWIAGRLSGSASWKLGTVGPADPFEPFTPLQQNDLGYQDGLLSLVGSELGAPDTRPAALVPFEAPATSASTISGDTVGFFGKTAIGFSTSSATAANFESSGQVWLEVDSTGLFPAGGNTGIARWTFHTSGLSGTTLSGTYTPNATGFNRLAVSYDPVGHVASAVLNGVVVASVPLTAQPIRYAGVEGSMFANIDNLEIRAGAAT